MAVDGAKERLDKLIADNAVVIVSKTGCPICLGARNIIRKHFGKRFGQDQVAFVDIHQDFETRAVRNYLKFITGGSDVPKIFINGKFVGGRDEVAELHKSGQLDTMLRDSRDLLCTRVDNLKPCSVIHRTNSTQE